MLQLGKEIDKWLTNLVNNSKLKYINNIYFTDDCILTKDNILEIIQFNFNKYFDEKYIIRKDIDISCLVYDENSKEDVEFWNIMSKILDRILEKFGLIFKKSITKNLENIKSLVSNCKCKAIYFSVFRNIKYFDLINQKNSLSSEILNILNS